MGWGWGGVAGGTGWEIKAVDTSVPLTAQSINQPPCISSTEPSTIMSTQAISSVTEVKYTDERGERERKKERERDGARKKETQTGMCRIRFFSSCPPLSPASDNKG